MCGVETMAAGSADSCHFCASDVSSGCGRIVCARRAGADGASKFGLCLASRWRFEVSGGWGCKRGEGTEISVGG
jgi:hypothetical protein